MAKLDDIDVDRVDGVDEPATQRKFLLMKSEEPDELKQNLSAIIERAEAAISALAKAADELSLTEEAAAALNALADAIGASAIFAAKKPKEEEYGYPEPDEEKYGKPSKKDVWSELAAIAARLDEHEAALKSLIDRMAVTKTLPRSRQPVAQDPIAKRDVWHKVFFGQEG